MTQPTYNQLMLAAEWLDQYNGASSDNAACDRVATWLREKAKASHERKVRNAAIKRIATERGVKPADIRKRLKGIRHE